MANSGKILILSVLFLFSACSNSDNIKIVKNERGERIALGQVTADQLLKNFSDYEKNYQDYEVDTLALGNLKFPQGKKEIIVVLGTWCSDSRREVPRFIKIMEKLAAEDISLKYICVDRSKKDGAGLTDAYEIEFVPTFIVKLNDQEIGRIVESPQISLEEDLLDIVNSVEY